MSDDTKKYRNAINEGAENVNRDDLGTVAAKADEILELIGRVDVLKKFAARAALLIRLISDYYNNAYTEVPWKTIAMAVFALLYVLNPVDLIPDYIPVIGFVDDAAVMGLAWMAIESDVKAYSVWKCGQRDVSYRIKELAEEAFPEMNCGA